MSERQTVSYTITDESTQLLRLPTGISVGDEFRVAGRVRVRAIAEEFVSDNSTSRVRRYTLAVLGLEVDS